MPPSWLPPLGHGGMFVGGVVDGFPFGRLVSFWAFGLLFPLYGIVTLRGCGGSVGFVRE